jgi:DNA-binding GntR family transcriptional regulator
MRSADLLMATTMSTGEDRLFQDRRNAIEPLEVTEGIASPDERVRLNLLLGDTVYRIRRVRRYGNQIELVEHARLPATLFPGLLGNSGVSDINALAKKYDFQLGKAIERISTGAASEPVANALNVVVGTPIVQLDRVVHLADGQPAEWRTACSIDPEKWSRLLN